ncbi:MAG: phospholipase D family protein [Variovorax sp.]
MALFTVGCASLRYDVPRVPSYAFDQPMLTRLGQSYVSQFASTPGQSGFHLLVSGSEAFAARAALAESTERTLDLQYYSITHGATSTLLMDSALRAARRGVRVRLLLDDLNVGARDVDLAMLAANSNVQVRLFNPFLRRGNFGIPRALEWLNDSDRLNRRMHNKLWIADGAVVVMGGRNLGDTYFDASPDGDFADLDVLATGPVVAAVARSFDEYWNSGSAVPIESIVGPAPTSAAVERARAEMAEQAARFRESDYAGALREAAFGLLVRTGRVPLIVAPAEVLYDAPIELYPDAGDRTSAIFPVLRRFVEKAQREVIMVSPYLVPGVPGVAALCSAIRRGIRVRILTNSLVSTDVPAVHAGYSRYRPELLACGVELYELRPRRKSLQLARPGLSSGASLHTKAMVVDGEVVFIGSMNLDPRSRFLNSEVALQIESGELGRQLVNLFDEATAPDQVFRVGLDEAGNANSALHWESIENGQPIRYTRDPLASEWRRWLARLLGAFTPEAML